jgi:gluconolactonase
MKVDRQGDVYSTGAGGVWIVASDGKRLGQVPAPDGGRFSNLAFGDADSKTLYVVTSKSLWRIRLRVPGIRP